MRNSEEVWQVEVNGQVYETTFGELPGWIADNALVETDKVRRGNLRWLEAGKVPSLVPFFNAKANGEPIPGLSVSTTDASEEHAESAATVPEAELEAEGEGIEAQANVYGTWSNEAPEITAPPANEFSDQVSPEVAGAVVPSKDFCSIHTDLPSEFVCSVCGHPFCAECPEGFGTTVKICPYCGAMCKPIEEVDQREQEASRIRSDIDAGFGFEDFGKAFAYPFRFKFSLFFGGLLFALFSLGQGAIATGSVFLVAGALVCIMMANALTFGVLANTVNNFTKGATEENFMPSFDEFSLWDDVVHPFFLSIAVYVSSFGVLVVLVVGMVWYGWNSIAPSMVPQGNPAQAMLADKSGPTPKHIKELLEKTRKQNEGRTDIVVGDDGLTDLQRQTLQEEAEFNRLNDLATNYQKKQIESTIGPSPDTRDENMRNMASQFFKFAGLFTVACGLALLWGLFYFPAACAVAGYTRSFMATINPLVGLDTIRHIGVDYVKILAMVIVITVLSVMVGAVLGMIFSPFDLPMFGNLPAKFFGGFATFYLSVVFAVVLGFALYKNSEKLGLYRG